MMEEFAEGPLADSSDLDGVKRRIVQFALGYLGLACLAVYVDYRIRLRRARKKREAEKNEEDSSR